MKHDQPMPRACLYILLMLLPSLHGMAQQCPDPSGKTRKAFDEALAKWKYDRKAARNELEALAEKQKDFADVHIFLGEEYYRAGDSRTAYTYFQNVAEHCPAAHPYAFFRMGETALTLKHYEKAEELLGRFLSYRSSVKDSRDLGRAEQLLEDARFYAGLFRNPVPFEPKLVTGISTEFDEYLAVISPDDEFFFFTRAFDRKKAGLPSDYVWELEGPDIVERFTRSRRTDGSFEKGDPMPPPFNTNFNEGGPSVSIDNKELYFTVCDKNKNCDICFTKYENGQWHPIRPLPAGINDPVQWDSQPTISSDGTTLYFSSTRAGGLGGADIYKAVRDESGAWGKPENLGPPVNTAGNEKSPFIHTDSQTLYFSSDGHTGLGGYDIFFARMDKDKGAWRKPANMGHPINTDGDDLGFVVSTDGKTAYFASNRIGGGKGGWDLYAFELYREARPEKVLFVKGEVKDEHGEAVKDVRIELKSMKTREVKPVKVDKEDGTYVAAVTVDKDEDFVLTVKKKDFAFNAVYLDTDKPELGAPAKVDFEVKKVQVGEAYRLNDITYASNSWQLTGEAMLMIEEFIGYLQENYMLKVAIHGHTDDVGDDRENRRLSENRSKSVYEYLIVEGVDPKRLSYKGFGESKPVAGNQTEEGRARNRRTEFVITGM